MLYKSPVIFDAENHTYTLNGKQLSGITSMLTRQLFPDKYKGIDKDRLQKAADRGHYVHEIIEMCDSLGVDNPNHKYKAYKRLRDEAGLKPLCNEYLISDEQFYASSIDIVFDDFSICDIKTTSSLDTDWLSWQLSIYAYLFELHNKQKVKRLLAIWLPDDVYGEPALIEIPRRPNKDVEELLRADSCGEQYQGDRHKNVFVLAESAKLPVPVELVSKIKSILLAEQEAKSVKDEFTQRMTELMEHYGIKKWISPDESIQITYVAPTKTTRFDSKAFKEDYEGVYELYLKESESKSSVRIKLNQK